MIPPSSFDQEDFASNAPIQSIDYTITRPIPPAPLLIQHDDLNHLTQKENS